MIRDLLLKQYGLDHVSPSNSYLIDIPVAS